MNERRINILLVEDNAGDARLVREYLAESGGRRHELVHVTSAKEALGALASRSFDIVLLDLGLPDAQGLDAFGYLQPAAVCTPVVLLTGLENDAVVLEAIEAGAEDYLSKARLDAELLTRTMNYAIERKQRRRELHDKAVELERANRLLRQFLITASHELQTPLTNLLSATEILTQHGADESADFRAEFLLVIDVESRRLSRLVRRMVDVTALETGTRAVAVEPFDLAVAVTRAVESVQPDSTERCVSIEVHGLDDHMPCEGDAALVERLVAEVIENAIAFAPAATSVRVTLRTHDSTYEIRVADKGPGVPEQRRKEIFQPFYQAHEVLTEKPAGLGLGLALAKNIAQQHDAAIWCEDNEGGGSVFVVAFPANTT